MLVLVARRSSLVSAVRRSHTLALTQLLVTYYLVHSAVAARTELAAPAAAVG